MIVLTGGAGFIGSCFLSKLNDMGVEDVLVVDVMGCDEKWKNLRGKRFSDYLPKDMFLEYLERDGFSDISAIIHLGANSSTTEKNVDLLLENNYRYSQRLAMWAARRSVRFIYASSAATYGAGECGYSDDEHLLPKLQPMNPYGFSKHLFDLWLLKNNLLQIVVGVKFFNVFGPNEYHKGSMRSIVCKAFEEIREHGVLRLFKSYRPEYQHGEQRRDFVYVKDCIEVLWWFLEHPEVHGMYNLGTGVSRTWNDMAKAIFSALHREPAIEYIDMPEEVRPHYQYYTEASMEKLYRSGYTKTFTALEDAVCDYVQNYLLKDYRIH